MIDVFSDRSNKPITQEDLKQLCTDSGLTYNVLYSYLKFVNQGQQFQEYVVK